MSFKVPPQAPAEMPEAGLVQAVCAFSEDLGMAVEDRFGPPEVKHKGVFLFELAEKMKSGKPFMLKVSFNVTRSPKGTLYGVLKSWNGKPPARSDWEALDLASFVGRNAMVNVIIDERESDGALFPKIETVMAYKGKDLIRPVNTVPPEWIEKQRKENAEATARYYGDQPADGHDVDEVHDQPNRSLPF